MGDDFQKAITFSFTAPAQKVDLGSPNTGTEVVQITGTWTGALIAEGCNDGVSYQPFFLINSSTFAIGSSITANGIYLIPTNGFAFIQLRASALSSGTAVMTEWGSEAVSITQGINFIRGGTDGTVIGNVSDALKINITNASGVSDKSTFTYGTTVQQVTGGVYQDGSPTLSAGQQGAKRLNANRALHTTLRDPTTDVGITSSSNGNAGDQLLHTQVPDTTTTSTALGALNASIVIAMAGLASAGLQLAAGTLVGTIVVECSLDGGATYPGIGSFYDSSNSTTVTSIVFGSANAQKTLSLLMIGGTSHVRVRVSAYTSGTANALLRASSVISAAGAITAAAYGTITNTFPAISGNTVTSILAANTNRKYAYISNGSGSQVNIQFGSGTGLTTTTGIPIPAKSFYELKGDNLFTGQIFALSASSITLSIGEGTP